MKVFTCLLTRLLIAIGAIYSYSPAANAMLFSEFGILNLSTPEFAKLDTPTSVRTLGISIGAGISLSYRILDKTDFEIGLSYLGQTLSVSSGNSRINYQFWAAHFPILARSWLSSNFSLGAGVYINRGLGSVGVSQPNQNISYDTYSNLKVSPQDHGAVLSAKICSPMTPLMSVILDGRLMFGFPNLFTEGSGSTFKTRTLQMLVGIAFIL